MIRITSKRHNFRRCGMAHPKGTTEHPDDRFSEDEIKILSAEAMLVVERMEDATEDIACLQTGNGADTASDGLPAEGVAKSKNRKTKKG